MYWLEDEIMLKPCLCLVGTLLIFNLSGPAASAGDSPNSLELENVALDPEEEYQKALAAFGKLPLLFVFTADAQARERKYEAIYLEHLKNAADLGHGEATTRLAYYHLNHRFEHNTFILLIRKAAQLGEEIARFGLARYKYEGRPEYQIEKDAAEAIEDFKILAQEFRTPKALQKLHEYCERNQINLDQ